MSWFTEVVVDDEYVVIPMNNVNKDGRRVEEYSV